METAWSSETFIYNHHTIWSNNSENSEFYLHRREKNSNFAILSSSLLRLMLIEQVRDLVFSHSFQKFWPFFEQFPVTVRTDAINSYSQYLHYI